MNKLIVALIVVVVVAVLTFVGLWASITLFLFNPAIILSPPQTGSQINAPTPASTAEITIQHEDKTYNSIVDKYGLTETPDAGNVWLIINMTITNKGYGSFNTNPYYFTVTINNIKYSYDSETYSSGNWNTVDILDGGSFDGSIVFQVPSSATSYTLSYDQYLTNYNIVYS